MELVSVLAVLSRWVHLLSVIVAIGGAIFMRFGLMPAADAVLSAETRDRLRSRIMARWKTFVHVSVALLIVTGAFNFYMSVRDGVEPMPYHAVFGVKLIMALAVFFFAIALTGSSPGFAKLREQSKKWTSVLIGLAVVIIMLSGVLKPIHQGAVST